MYYIIIMLKMFLIDIRGIFEFIQIKVEKELLLLNRHSTKETTYLRKLHVKMVNHHAFRLFSTPNSSEPLNQFIL